MPHGESEAVYGAAASDQQHRGGSLIDSTGGHTSSVQPRTPPTGDSKPSTAQLALFNVSDQVEYLNDTHRAYEALEQLLTPTSATDRQRLDRAALASLLRVLNRAMREQIDATAKLLHEGRQPAKAQ